MKVQQSSSGNAVGSLTNLRVYRDSTDTNTDAMHFLTQIESINAVELQGKTVTFSTRLRLESSFSAANVNISINSGTGIDESAQMTSGVFATGNVSFSNLSAVDISIKGTYQIATYTINVPSDCTELSLQMQWTPVGSASDSLDGIRFDYIKLEVGSVATPYQARPIGEE